MSRRKKRTPADKPTRPRFRWLHSVGAWITLGWIATAAAVAYGLNHLEPRVRVIASADATIEWVTPPDWLLEENWSRVLPELEERIALHPLTDLYDDRVCPYVAERLSGSPWIAEINRVSKFVDGKVRVAAEFRKPFAMVEQGRTVYLVDQIGTRLPLQWEAADINRADWWIIRGVTGPRPEPGEAWQGADLAAGLKLADYLYRTENAGGLPYRSKLQAIDVSNFEGRKDRWAGHLRLITTNPQSYVHWGAPPGEEFGVESSAERKLQYLSTIYEMGRLPDAKPIDLRDEECVSFGEPG